MWPSYSAELLKLRKRLALWILGVIWLALLLLFTYLIPYTTYRAHPGAAGSARLLAELLPAHLAGQGLSGYAVWGGALLIVLGAMTLGAEYGWGTLKTMLSVRAGRLTVLAGQLAALYTAVLLLVLVAFLLSGVASVLIAATAHASLASPSAAGLVRSVAAGWLILSMWCTLGAALAVSMRSVAFPIGLGLLWLLVVENLVRATAPALGAVSALEKGLPGVNAGALVAALDPAHAAASGSEGIAPIVGGGQALAVVLLYLLLFAAASAVLLRRRDVI